MAFIPIGYCTGTDNDGERMGDVDHSRLAAYRLLLTADGLRGPLADTIVKVERVTDRDRIRSKADVISKKEVVRVERDTVYVERKDSILVKSEELRVKSSLNPRPSTLILTLKWMFAVICAVVVLIIVVKLKVEN